MNKLKCQVIMLPTMNYLNSTIWHNPKSNHISFVSNKMRDITTNYVPQHLYFVSDKEVKNDDIFYSFKKNAIFKASYINKDEIICEYGTILAITNTKVVASTDKSLRLPLIPNKWIEEVFIPKQGNIGNIIVDFVERTEPVVTYNVALGFETAKWIPTGKFDVIITSEFKESYTLDDIYSAIEYGFNSGKSIRRNQYENWLKGNGVKDFIKSIQ